MYQKILEKENKFKQFLIFEGSIHLSQVQKASMTFDFTKTKPLIDFTQIATDQLIEIIRQNKKEKLFQGISLLRQHLTTVEYFNDIPAKIMIEAIDNFTYLDFFPDDAEKIDYSEEIEKEVLQILEDEETHSKIDLIQQLNQKFNEDITQEFNEIVRKLLKDHKIIKFDRTGNIIENSGRGSGKYSSIKKAPIPKND